VPLPPPLAIRPHLAHRPQLSTTPRRQPPAPPGLILILNTCSQMVILHPHDRRNLAASRDAVRMNLALGCGKRLVGRAAGLLAESRGLTQPWGFEQPAKSRARRRIGERRWPCAGRPEAALSLRPKRRPPRFFQHQPEAQVRKSVTPTDA